MRETLRLFREFASTPAGAVILAVLAIIVVALLLKPLWQSLKYLFKALLWALLAVLILGAAFFAAWLWMEREAPDQQSKETLRREAVGLVQDISTNVGSLFPSNRSTNHVE